MKSIDLNADLGEGGTQDEALMAVVSSANIACGGHAGDQDSMLTAVALAQAYDVAIGAHPGYEDPINFGRNNTSLSPADVSELVKRQIERLAEITPEIHHVKPHGALYHQANNHPDLAKALIIGIQTILPNTLLYAPPHGELSKATASANMGICHEGFIDRGYQADGQLIPRDQIGALIEITETAVHQALEMVQHQQVTHQSNGAITMPVNTLCVHGDSPVAVQTLIAVRRALENIGMQIKAPSTGV